MNGELANRQVKVKRKCVHYELRANDRPGGGEPTMRRAMLLMVAMAASAIAMLPAAAQPPDTAAGSRVRIEYVQPNNPAHRPIYERLQKRRVLEDFQRLPVAAEAAGAAHNQDRRLQRRGERLVQQRRGHDLLRIRRVDSPDRGEGRGRDEISLEDAVVGPFVDVLLHEVAHALFDLLKIPLFGREEDAADQLAAFMLLQFGNDVARRTIVGAALAVPADGGRPAAGHRRLRRGARPAGAALHQRAVHCLRCRPQAVRETTSSRGTCRVHRIGSLPLGVPADRARLQDADQPARRSGAAGEGARTRMAARRTTGK